jgi:S-adenosylmethionine decarboxylase
MHGLHLTADLHDCRCSSQWLVDAKALGAVCRKAATAAGLQPVGELFQSFPATPQGPGGVTATVLLAESHLCVHTWPELRAATLDVYVCNVGANHSPAAHALMDCLIALFEPQRSDLNALQRGALVDDAAVGAGSAP